MSHLFLCSSSAISCLCCLLASKLKLRSVGGHCCWNTRVMILGLTVPGHNTVKPVHLSMTWQFSSASLLFGAARCTLACAIVYVPHSDNFYWVRLIILSCSRALTLNTLYFIQILSWKPPGNMCFNSIIQDIFIQSNLPSVRSRKG